MNFNVLLEDKQRFKHEECDKSNLYVCLVLIFVKFSGTLVLF